MNLKPYNLHYYNTHSGQLQQDIWSELSKGLWKKFSINNYMSNNNILADQPHLYRPILNDFTPIYSGTKWNFKTKRVEEELFYPKQQPFNKKKFYQLCELFFDSYSNKKIGVHLSGGLDSSIIIGILNKLNIPFYLIGLKSQRFEFRTEKAIQEKLAPLGIESVLIDMDDYPSFSKLSLKPPHQLPDGNIKQVEAAKAIASACKKLDVDVVFTGQGGDTLFADAIPANSKPWGCNIGNEFFLNYEANFLYPKYNLELVSFYADKQIIEAIYNLRLGQSNDFLKKWARDYFKDILPRELVNYTYSADFFGTSLSGLEKAKPDIEKLFKTAYDITKHSVFSKQSTTKMLATDVFDFEYQSYTDFCNRISLAVWYHSLLKGGFIT